MRPVRAPRPPAGSTLKAPRPVQHVSPPPGWGTYEPPQRATIVEGRITPTGRTHQVVQSIPSMRRRVRIGPSPRLRLAAGYFTVSGLVMLGIRALSLFDTGFGSVRMAMSHAAGPMGEGLVAATALGLLWTGHLLRRRERTGGLLALATMSLPVTGWLLGRPIELDAAAFAVIGVIAIASTWRELR
jgi:hypothetical protein